MKKEVCVSCGRDEAMEGELICFNCKNFINDWSINEDYQSYVKKENNAVAAGRLKSAYEYACRKYKDCKECSETVCTSEMAQFCDFVRVSKKILEKNFIEKE